MIRLIKPIFWTFLFLIMMLAIDQFLVQVPPANPAHAVISNFYRDFRGRMTDIMFGEKRTSPASIEAVINDQGKKHKATSPESTAGKGQGQPTAKTQAKDSRRYIYSDAHGELQFADSLEEVPRAFRGQAQPMGE